MKPVQSSGPRATEDEVISRMQRRVGKLEAPVRIKREPPKQS
jgi:hypothetical protein